MTFGRRLARRWRSVSFRSGLVSALSVGVVATIAAFMVTALVFVLFALAGAAGEIGVVDRVQDQLLLGVEPADVDLESTFDLVGDEAGAGDGTQAFWAILSGDETLNGEGELNRAVLDAEFSNTNIDFDANRQPGDQIGVKTVDGQDWFFLRRNVAVPGGPTYQVVSAYDGTFSLWRFVRSTLVVTVPLLLALMGVAMAVTSWLTRRALRRVERMRAAVEQITQQSLDRRVPTVDASDDIEKLAHTMNDMLGRLESSSAQQSQFLADASHELRSPVAGLLAQLDVASMYPDRVDQAVLLPKLRNEAGRLQLLVDDLLFLSRSEAGGGSAGDDFTSVAVDGLLAAEQAHQRDLDERANVVVGSPCGAHVHGDQRDLERALRNLVDNAVRHCADEVRLEAHVSGVDVVVTVSDDGPGIAAGDEERIFRRFVRLDEARTRDGGGSGLGLAIASEIAANHNGSIALVPSQSGATFALTLPSR